LRSVNQRFLDPQLRLPDQFHALEPKLRDLLRNRLNRGKVECQLRWHPATQESELQVNEALVKQLNAAGDQVNSIVGPTRQYSVLELLQWPGVLAAESIDLTELPAAALTLFETSLEELIAHREREGQALKGLIEQRLDAILAIVSQVQKNLPGILAQQRQNLQDRLAELGTELDPQRLEQEIALLANKADVAEELDRLVTHVEEVRHTLQQKQAIGRRLDFLMQELNREANTLSSKSIVTETTLNAVELKVLIEQMREQVQNIE
ncbi:MAG: YicC/YloC family endoribonuclease, partial [Pseudomonadales bacterium]